MGGMEPCGGLLPGDGQAADSHDDGKHHDREKLQPVVDVVRLAFDELFRHCVSFGFVFMIVIIIFDMTAG